MTRGSDAGEQMADTLLEWLNLMYQRQTRKRVLSALIARLQQAETDAEAVEAASEKLSNHTRDCP